MVDAPPTISNYISVQLQRNIFRRASRTYFNATRFFPWNVRRDVWILYAFVRSVDSFVDVIPQQPQRLADFYERYHQATRSPIGDPLIDDYVEMLTRRRCDPQWVEDFFASMTLDLTKRVYSSLEELIPYIHGSAEVIGLFMSRIMGLTPKADQAACMMGRSMQYINFIRDIAEDNQLGRTYLPLNEHALQIHTTLPDFSESTCRQAPEEFRRVIATHLDIYQQWHNQALEGYRYIPRRYLIPIKTACDMYHWTATKIKKNPFIVFQRPIKPRAPRIILQGLYNLLFNTNILEQTT